MTYTRETITSPSELVVSVDEIKEHLALAPNRNDFDDLLTKFIEQATETAQEYTQRQFVTATYKYHFRGFPVSNRHEVRRAGEYSLKPEPLIIPDAPFASLIEIEYDAPDGTTQTLTDTQIVGDTPAELHPQADTQWPATRPTIATPVRVTASVGYGDQAAQPAEVRALIANMVHYAFVHRDGGSEVTLLGAIHVHPPGIQRLLNSLSWGAEVAVWPV